MWTRRDMLQQTGAAAVLATTTPWWMIRRAHAARQHKLVVWNPAALAPQVDKIMEEQCYAYAKQAGIKDNEIDYSTIGSAQILSKLVASLEAGNPPDVTRLGSGAVQFYRVPGHLLEVTDLVEKLQKVEGGLFQASLDTVMYQGKAYGVPQSISPRPLITRLDILEAGKVEPPKTWEALVEVCKKLQKPPKLTGLGMCLGLYSDASNDIMNIIWSYGGQLIEADKKTVGLNSPETVAAVNFIADMYNKHKMIPKGSIGWDNTGNNKAFQSKQVIFVLNPTSIYAHLDQSDKELHAVTGLLPVPAGPAGAVDSVSTTEWLLFKKNPHPELAKGLVDHWMDPKNLRVTIEEGGGRWGPPYQGMYASDFWKRPAFEYWLSMLERGRQFSYASTMNPPAGEVLSTSVLPRMVHRTLVDGWEAEQAVAEAHKQAVQIFTRHQEREG
jgi:multiple sugar transport system substrate-binding protein